MPSLSRVAAPVVGLLTAGVLGSCTHSTSAPTSTDTPTTLAVRRCTASELRTLVGEFVRAFNAGDRPTLERLWTQQGHGFGWYSTDGPGRRVRGAAHNRTGLGAYFAARHAEGETLRLTGFRFNGESAGYGNFQYTLVRASADLPPTGYVGKGAARCTSVRPTLAVWSMARDPTHQS
jgi:hypothetical protein